MHEQVSFFKVDDIGGGARRFARSAAANNFDGSPPQGGVTRCRRTREAACAASR
jgi:hypothetical protein